MNARPLATGPWSVLAVLALAAAWLIPNQYAPWPSFYREAWIAAVLLLLAAWALLSDPAPIAWPSAASALLMVAALPLLQAAAGQQFFAGTAWTIGAYLFGAGLAALAGARWQQTKPGAPIDTLFAATLLAALLSVGIQLWQWLGLGHSVLWALPMARGGRPFANLGQPNLLALLLLWGLVAAWWFAVSGRTRSAVALPAAAWLLLGLAMTQSRWAWLGLGLLAVAAMAWRGPLDSRPRAPALVGLLLWFISLVLAWGAVNRSLGFEAARSLESVATAGPRPQGWTMLLDGLSRHPWAGYGWGQGVRAHHEVALDYPALLEVYTYSHNLALDLLLWNGIPLGLLLLGALSLWALRHLRRARGAEACLLLLALALLGMHAAIEWPHAYAYFLLPAALMAGVLGVLHADPPAPERPRALGALLLLCGALWFGVLAQDYLRAEESQWALRFEQRRIGPQRDSRPPDVVLLTQLRAFAIFVRMTPERSMTPDRLALMHRIAELNPSGNALRHYAHALALNGRPAEARDALLRMCKLSSEAVCAAAGDYWRRAASEAPALDAVAVPQWRRP